MLQYKKPDSCQLKADFRYLLCDSLTGSSSEDFTEQDFIEW